MNTMIQKHNRIIMFITLISFMPWGYTQSVGQLSNWCQLNPEARSGMSKYLFEILNNEDYADINSQELEQILKEGKLALDGKNYSDVLKKMEQALEVVEKLKDNSLKAKLLTNIGQLHFSLRQYEIALNYHFKALDAYRSINNVQSVNFNIIRIAEIYLELDQYQEATRYIVTLR